MTSALIIRTAGTNCDAELMRAFELAGARPTLMHLDRLVAEPRRLEDFDILGFPGGFSYGDDIASGRIFAMRLRERLYAGLREAASRGVPMIGVCNGFQVLVQVGLLPGPPAGEEWPMGNPPRQEASLAGNAEGSFVDTWVRVEANPASRCIWTRGLIEYFDGERAGAAVELMRLPIAHGEGRFVVENDRVMQRLEKNQQIALRYLDNVNGSQGATAGVCDVSGRIFGLMPHPERYLEWENHPFWTRLPGATRRGDTPGLAMFRAAVEAAGKGAPTGPRIASAV
ncbi:MAG: phosphoribosylformylglycinamidine synthase subunit PurQ [Phycisphaerales bacterium]|nr:phosphoribosylformylglycinamidine synthase subunit PurQ [Phycisphaerales bacterium]